MGFILSNECLNKIFQMPCLYSRKYWCKQLNCTVTSSLLRLDLPRNLRPVAQLASDKRINLYGLRAKYRTQPRRKEKKPVNKMPAISVPTIVRGKFVFAIKHEARGWNLVNGKSSSIFCPDYKDKFASMLLEEGRRIFPLKLVKR